MTSLSYVLPIRTRSGDVPPDELSGYLAWLSKRAEVIVVDGSDPDAFRAHGDRWSAHATHVAPDEDIRCRNGKVRGVLTGLRVASHDLVVVADDDVRYDDGGLARLASLLMDADLVRPQNHFDPLPWHARWDTARMLLNRSIASDHPGTLGVRRSFLRSIGGYDGDVLFENLELVRTVAAAGGRVVEAPDLFVRRRPPTLARFLEQRPRQAYDDWAQPFRFAAFLATAPVAVAVARRRPALLAAGAASIVLVAGIGRIRRGGRRVFDPVSPFLAPLWVAERAVLSWQALGRRVLGGGCPYAGTVIRRAATPPRELRRRFRTPAD
jgi:glycosyl transferase family 2